MFQAIYMYFQTMQACGFNRYWWALLLKDVLPLSETAY